MAKNKIKNQKMVKVGNDDFLTISHNAPCTHMNGTTKSDLLNLLLADGEVTQGFYQRWDGKELNTDCPSSRANDGFYYDVEGNRLLSVVAFQEIENK